MKFAKASGSSSFNADMFAHGRTWLRKPCENFARRTKRRAGLVNQAGANPATTTN